MKLKLPLNFIIILVSFLLGMNFTIFPQNTNADLQLQNQYPNAVKLAKPVNTASGEFAPAISADGRTLIFESDREQKYNWKLYVVQKTDSNWSEPRQLDSVNSSAFNGAPFLTYDQNYLLISSDRPNGYGGMDIWISQRIGNTWSNPVNFGKPINSSGYDGFASLSSDGNTIYFMREESKGNCNRGNSYDLYTSQKINGVWNEPEKLPYPINSEYCEGHPVILSDSKTLIFSSTRPGGFGGYDLYKSEKQIDGNWSEPKNLGSFINSEKDEEVVTIPASGDLLYFSSGDRYTPDIYSIKIPSEVQPSKVIAVTGTIKDSANNKFLKAKITIINVDADNDSSVVYSNGSDGKYIVILNKGKKYDVSVSADGYTYLSTQFDLRKIDSYFEIKNDIFLEPISVGAKIVLNNIYFKFNSDSLLDMSKYELQRVVKFMKDNPNIIVEISGHTDNIASHKYNYELSLKRSRSVIKELVKNGIETNRLIANGYGETQPIESNDTESGRMMNRRVEFKIIQMEK